MLPGIGRESGLEAGLSQKGLAVPIPLRRNLRQQQSAAQP